MCYNVEYIERRQEKYRQRYQDLDEPTWNPAPVEDELPSYYFVSGFVHPKLPVVKADGISLYSWGLIPSWVKDEKSAKEIRTKTLNAVGETVFDKPSFRSSIMKKRCLLGVNGFYEWREFNGTKYPYLIKHSDDEIVSLGAIYENWVNRETGEIHDTFSIITTPANPLMEKIHNLKKRMPLIIDRKDEAQWIDAKLTKEQIQKLITPYSEEKMRAHTVSRMVNSPKNNRNVPEAVEKFIYPELDAA